MNIAWQYLDKRAATVSALKDYESMKSIAEQAPHELANLRQQMMRINSPAMSDMPRDPFDPHSGESRTARALDALDALSAKYQQALSYMAWFQPGWQALTEDERFVLRCFYMTEEQHQADNVCEICEAFHIERTSAYKKKDRALSRLSLMLYGR